MKFLTAVALAVVMLWVPVDGVAQNCYESAVVNPTPFMGNGDEIIQLDDGSYWREVSYQYLYLYEYNPSVVFCPAEGILQVGENQFTVVPVECRTDFMQEPTPFMGNGGELIRLGDGTIWRDLSYLYLYLYEYNPSVVICPAEGILQVGENQFTVSQVIPSR
jgi:hypothetical protein